MSTGETVSDRTCSHVPDGARELLPEALNKIRSNGRGFIVEAIDFGRIIGQSLCVPTEPSDEIFFSRRPGRRGQTRFVRKRQPRDVTVLTVILKRREDGSYILITAYFGEPAPPEPWDRNAPPNSRTFWNSHALVWEEGAVVSDSVTFECPW